MSAARVVWKKPEMTELALQTFLRKYRGGFSDLAFAELDNLYGVTHRRHKDYPNLITFKYRHTACNFSEPLVREARGIILDEADNWNVVARAFDKFFNYGEGLAAEIDWETAKVYEKYDGTLCLMYHYDGKWHVGTTGTPDGSGTVPFGGGMTFAELFWQTFEAQGLSTEWACEDVTYIFELVSPLNRVVVRYPNNDLLLIGVRDLELDEEYRLDDPGMWKSALGESLKLARTYPLTSPRGVTLHLQRSGNPLEHEGFVVRDDKFNRVKVKDPAYVALHHLAGGISRRRVIELVMANEYEEVLSAFPEYKPQIDEVREQLSEVKEAIKEAAHETRKSMALRAKDFGVFQTGAMCLTLGKFKTVDDYIQACRIQQIEGFLDQFPVTPDEDEAL